ncbi:MAG: SDR family NAD(P)-dependent oxidoreductase [Halolamina sp.]
MTDAAIVTGAASGIGRATVDRLRERYDLVAGLDVDPAVKTVADDLDGVRGYVADVADHDRVHEVVADVEADADVVAAVNNAAVSRYYPLSELDPDEWREVLDVNLTGQYNVAHAVGPEMVDRGRGTIVNVSSGAGQRGSASGGVHYSASKAGVLGLTKGLAKQLAPDVRVNCVVPGLMDTPLTTDSGLWDEAGIDEFTDRVPLGRLGDPEEAAALVDFLCSDQASYVTGAVLNVDGGAALV